MANNPTDGRITSLNSLSTVLLGSEVLYIVSPGNASAGVSYQISSNALATFVLGYALTNAATITSGASYSVKITDTQVLVNKTVGSATSIIFPNLTLAPYPFPIVVKDLKGDAHTNPITITFVGGQLCDGLSSIVIDTNFGWVTINPTTTGPAAWYLT